MSHRKRIAALKEGGSFPKYVPPPEPEKERKDGPPITKEGWIRSKCSERTANKWYPVITEDTDSNLEITCICRHGAGMCSCNYYKDEDTGKWHESEEGWRDAPCDLCDDLTFLPCCPNCHYEMKLPTREFAAKLFSEGKNLLADTMCPKCGHSWLIPDSEIEQHNKEGHRLKHCDEEE